MSPSLRMLSAPVPPEDVEALRRLARADDRSVSSLVRRAIRDLIENSEAATDGSATSTSDPDGRS